jgi:hypothetical protein
MEIRSKSNERKIVGFFTKQKAGIFLLIPALTKWLDLYALFIFS